MPESIKSVSCFRFNMVVVVVFLLLFFTGYQGYKSARFLIRIKKEVSDYDVQMST